MSRHKSIMFWLTASLAVVSLVAAACSSGVPQKDMGALKAQLAQAQSVIASDQSAIAAMTTELADLRAASGDKNAALTKIQASFAEKEKEAAALSAKAVDLEAKFKAIVPVTVAQTGQIQAAPTAAQPSGWDTPESIRGGLKLVATFDSSGPDAWDAKAHPMVYVTSLGGTGSDGKTLYPGLYIVDAYTKEVVASANYNLGATVSPHTVGASPDGKWLYLEGARLAEDGKTTDVVVFIINARTLKIDKVLDQQSMFMGSLRSQNLHHVTGFADSKGRDRLILEFGFGSTGGPHLILDPKDNNRVVKAITMDDTGYPMGHPFLTVDPTGKYVYVSLKMAAWAGETHDVGGIAKINLETNAVTIIPGVGDHIIGMMLTADGKFLYVNDAENSFTYKIDNERNAVVTKTSSGVTGPYGLALTWDEKLLYTVGKGETGPNQGHVLGVVDTTTFRPASSTLLGVNQPIELGEGSRTADHAFLHPDPKVNELWVSNMGGTVTTVLDLKTNTVKARIPNPNGGNTHSGAFIQCNADGTGKVLADHGGPKKDMLTTRLAMAQAAAAATK